MRPASEIHNAIDLLVRSRSRLVAQIEQDQDRDDMSDIDSLRNLVIAIDVLRWVAGGHWSDLTDGPNPWLVAYLLDDPPKIDPTPPEVN